MNKLKKSKVTKIVVIVALASAVLISLLFFLVNRNNKSSESTTSTTKNNSTVTSTKEPIESTDRGSTDTTVNGQTTSTISVPDVKTFGILNVKNGDTITPNTTIKVFVPAGGYTLKVSVNSDKWGEVFFTERSSVSGIVEIKYSPNREILSGPSGNIRAILYKDNVEKERTEIWVNF